MNLCLIIHMIESIMCLFEAPTLQPLGAALSMACQFCGSRTFSGSHRCAAVKRIESLQARLGEANRIAKARGDQLEYIETNGTAAAAIVAAARRLYPEEAS
jgi:hypothetical protein